MFPPCYVAAVEAATEQDWPGQRLGLPASGPGAAAGWARRIVALVIDWIMSLLVTAAITGHNPWAFTGTGATTEHYAVLVMTAEIWILTSLIQGSAGQVVMRVAVRRIGGGSLDPIRALVRTLLILLVIPAVIYNRDQRGLHDLAVDSVVVRR
jgi:hypothetical protein